jgi:hypothetical protein
MTDAVFWLSENDLEELNFKNNENYGKRIMSYRPYRNRLLEARYCPDI